MANTSFHTTFSTIQFLHLRAKNGSESGLRSTVSYRFGFNGKENDNEVKGIGNSVDFGARIYDSRLGRWLSTDPLQAKYPSLSPYQFCSNNPIMNIDPDGKRIFIAIVEKDSEGKPIISKLQYKNGKLFSADGTEYKGNNQFAQDVVTSLNHIVYTKADIGGLIRILTSTEEGDVTIIPGVSDQYDPETNELSWSRKGMRVWNTTEKTKGWQSASLGLFHELVHGYLDIFLSEKDKEFFEKSDDQYDNYEDRVIIALFESPCAKILGEATRDNHSGVFMKRLSSVISTKTRWQNNAERRKERKLNEKIDSRLKA